MEAVSCLAASLGALLFFNLSRSGSPTGWQIGVRPCHHVRITVVHVLKEAPIAYVVVLTRPQLVILVVGPINYVTIHCNPHNLQILVRLAEAAITAQKFEGILSARGVVLAQIKHFLVQI